MHYLRVLPDKTKVFPYQLERLYVDFPWEFNLDVSPHELAKHGIFEVTVDGVVLSASQVIGRIEQPC